jgi:hypothetical protein
MTGCSCQNKIIISNFEAGSAMDLPFLLIPLNGKRYFSKTLFYVILQTYAVEDYHFLNLSRSGRGGF